MTHEAVLSVEGERAIAEVGPRLAAVPEAAVVRPNTDPHGAAITGLLVSDWLGQPERADALASAKLTPSDVRELGQLARVILATVTELGGEYLPDAKGVPGDLVQRGTAIRGAMLERLERGFPHDDEVKSWVEAIRLGSGVVDLVYDLRTLAELHTRHAAALEGGAAAQGRAAADALEFALRSGETPEQARRRTLLSRAWTLFATAYERGAAVARSAAPEATGPRKFPPLALVASHRRARRRPISVMPPSRKSSPAGASLEDSMEVLVPKGPQSRPPSVPPGPVAERNSFSESRRNPRQQLELEVGFSSESNFFVGFTENLSNGGVFVATYAMKPLGSELEVTLTLPQGEILRLKGIVRWQRGPTADGWPGLGVQFEDLSPEAEEKIQKFLSMREPMFYDV